MSKHLRNPSASKNEVKRLLEKGTLKAKEDLHQPESAPSREYFSPLKLFDISNNDVLDIFSFFLDPNQIHGKKELFLKGFCNLLRSRNASLFSDEWEKIFLQTDKIKILRKDSSFEKIDILILLKNYVLALIFTLKNEEKNVDQNIIELNNLIRKKHKKATPVIINISEENINNINISAFEFLIQLSLSEVVKTFSSCAQQSSDAKIIDFISLFVDYMNKEFIESYYIQKDSLYDLMKDEKNACAAALIMDAYIKFRRDTWEKFTNSLAKQCQIRYKGKVAFYSSDLNDLNINSTIIQFSFSDSKNWAITFACNTNKFERLNDFMWGISSKESKDCNFSHDAELTESLSYMMRNLFGEADFPSSRYWAWCRKGKDPFSISLQNDFPVNLEDPKWLGMLIKHDENELTECIWHKIDLILSYCKNE